MTAVASGSPTWVSLVPSRLVFALSALHCLLSYQGHYVKGNRGAHGVRADAFFIGVLVGITLAFAATRAERLDSSINVRLGPETTLQQAPSATAPVAK